MLTINEALEMFKADILPAVVEQYGADDEVAASEAWDNFTDSLCKDGDFSELQYNHCPAWGEDAPADIDAERTFLLESLGLRLGSTRIDARTDGTNNEWSGDASHWRVTLYRGSKSFSIEYTMGSAHDGEPTLEDVVYCALSDTSGELDDFETWAEQGGFDTDSRKAERMYHACKAELAALQTLFTTRELEDLRTLFEDY